MSKHEVAVELAGGKRLVFETGRMAKQASGAALVTTGETVVLATAVASPEPREGIDFFPLTVDYREYTYAGGRIPGGFIKREGRPSEKEVLTCRQIDRPIRPLFPDGFRNETQVIALVFSADKENDPDVVGINAAACALALSDIPFSATVGAVRVGRVDGEFVINPTYAERAATTVNIMVVGHKDGIVMIESGAKEESEEVILAAIEFGHAEIKKIVAAIDELVALAGKPKRAFTAPEFDEAYYDELKAKIGDRLKDALDTKTHDKLESQTLIKAIKDELAAELPADDPGGQEEAGSLLREAARADLPRAGDQGAHSARPPRSSTRFARSPSRPAFCPACTARRCLPAARRRLWLRPRWAPPTTDSGWRAMRARRRSPSCCTTTSRPSAWARRAA